MVLQITQWTICIFFDACGAKFPRICFNRNLRYFKEILITATFHDRPCNMIVGYLLIRVINCLFLKWLLWALILWYWIMLADAHRLDRLWRLLLFHSMTDFSNWQGVSTCSFSILISNINWEIYLFQFFWWFLRTIAIGPRCSLISSLSQFNKYVTDRLRMIQIFFTRFSKLRGVS
jgi:hypothetical protein